MSLKPSYRAQYGLPLSISDSDHRANRRRLYLLAFFLPFVAAMIAVLRPRLSQARNLVWIFVVFYGAIFHIAAGSGSDSVRYAESLMLMNQEWFGLGELTSQFFSEGSRYQDIYQPLITFFVSRFTDQHWLLFAAFGVLFGFAYSRNIWFLIDRTPAKLGWVGIFLILAYAFTKDIGLGLNGVRMWTALHVFIYGFLHYNATGDRRFLLVVLSSALIHFSFWLPIAVLALFFLVKRFGLPIYAFFLVSYVASWIDLTLVQTLMSYLPLPIEQRASSYILDADLRQQGLVQASGYRAWFLSANSSMRSLFVLLTASWLVWRGCLLRSDLVRNLLVFSMLMYGIVNMVSYIPSLGRFYNLAEMVLIAATVLFLADYLRARTLDRQVLGAVSPLLVINVALGVRGTLDFATIWLLMGNFLVAPFVSAEDSLFQLIRWLPLFFL